MLLPEKAESLQQQPQEQTAANEGQTAEAASQTPLLLPEKAESLQQQPQEQTQQAQQEPQKPMLALPPHIEENLNKETQEATTALAVYDPAKAQEAKSQIAATPGIADRLQITGKTADAAQGNAVKAAQQQRHQQEAALVVANTQGKGGR